MGIARFYFEHSKALCLWASISHALTTNTATAPRLPTRTRPRCCLWCQQATLPQRERHRPTFQQELSPKHHLHRESTETLQGLVMGDWSSRGCWETVPQGVAMGDWLNGVYANQKLCLCEFLFLKSWHPQKGKLRDEWRTCIGLLPNLTTPLRRKIRKPCTQPHATWNLGPATQKAER